MKIELTEEEKSRGMVIINGQKKQPVEVWTRVMGYFRPVSYFNPGKTSEHKDRIPFIEQCCMSNKLFSEQYAIDKTS